MGDFATMAMMGMSAIQSSQQQKSQQATAMARQRADIQQRQYQLQIQERDKRNRLKQAEAAQRARFGGQGLGSSSGSAAALLAGMRKQTEQSIADQNNLEGMRIGALANKTKKRGPINLLEHQNTIRQGIGLMSNLLER